jgi:hypothetical protein
MRVRASLSALHKRLSEAETEAVAAISGIADQRAQLFGLFDVAMPDPLALQRSHFQFARAEQGLVDIEGDIATLKIEVSRAESELLTQEKLLAKLKEKAAERASLKRREEQGLEWKRLDEWVTAQWGRAE